MTTETFRGRAARTAMVSALVALALAGATSFVLFPVFSGRGASPVLHIHEPRAWSAEAADAIEVGAGRSVAISGVARHTGPIVEVRLNGRRLAMTSAGEPNAIEFSGFFDARDLRPDGTIEVEARGIGSARTVRRFPVAVLARPEAGPDFEEVDRGDRSQRWAVVIGAGAHEHPGLEPAARAADDARAVADFLISPAAGLGGFPATHMRVLLDEHATARDIRSALKTFLRAAIPGDLVVIFVAGRVVADPGRPARTYLLAYDTDPADIPATALDLRFLNEAVEEVYGHTRVVIADLSMTPSLERQVETILLDRMTARQGGLAAVMSAGADHFTYRLLHGLRGRADTDQDGVVRLDEMLSYAEGRVALTTYDRAWPMAAVPAPTATTAAAAPGS